MSDKATICPINFCPTCNYLLLKRLGTSESNCSQFDYHYKFIGFLNDCYFMKIINNDQSVVITQYNKLEFSFYKNDKLYFELHFDIGSIDVWKYIKYPIDMDFLCAKIKILALFI